MHILFFYQYYHNADCAATGRHHTLIEHLARRHRVTLLTTNTWYERRITTDFAWVPDDVTLHMFDVPYTNAMGPLRRLSAFVQYAIRSIAAGLRTDPADVIFGSSTPLTAAWAAASVARLRHTPWVFEVRDLWPDFPIQMGALPFGWLQRGAYALEHWLYRTAGHVVTVSPDMTEHVRATGVPSGNVTTLLQGTDFELIERGNGPDASTLRERFDLNDRHLVLYAGTFGRANDIPTLLAAARHLRHRRDLVFLFVGDGYHAPTLRAAAAEQDNVVVIPPQPRHRIFAWFRVASVTLVPFIDLPVLATNAPAKFFDSLAAGTPVIVTNPGWTRAWVEEHGCGWYTPPSNPEALAAQIERIFERPDALIDAGRRGAAAAREPFDRREVARRLESILEQVARRRH